jgi:aromatic ring hydroxylase
MLRLNILADGEVESGAVLAAIAETAGVVEQSRIEKKNGEIVVAVSLVSTATEAGRLQNALLSFDGVRSVEVHS